MANIDSESVAIGKHITSQLRAMSRSRERWRRFRIHEIVCQACGRPIAEVMETDPHPVLLYSQIDDEREEAPLDLGAQPRRGRLPIRRSATRRFDAIAWPLPEEEVTRSHIPIIAWCSCRRVSIDGAQLYDDLRAKTRRRVIPRDSR